MARLLIVDDSFALANLIATAARARGHQALAVTTGQAAVEAADGQDFDAAVVDLFLPDMAGAEVLAHLRRRGVPVFAMSGVYRGSSFAREVVGRDGAAAFFEKPFAIVDLLSAIARLTRGPPTPPLAREGVALPLELPSEASLASEPPGLSAHPIAPPEEWERAWQRTAATAPAPAAAAARATVPRTGSLKDTSMPRLLTALYQGSYSGELVVRQSGGPALKLVSVEEGVPVYAASNLAHERFARFCARRGKLRQDDLEPVAALAREQHLRTGDAMVKLGVLTEAERLQLLAEQIKEIIWSTFSWTTGDFAFGEDRPLRADVLKLTLAPGALILEGCLREPLVALRARLPREKLLAPSEDPPWPMESLAFSSAQARLILLTDGTKTVDDLLALSDLEERETLALLHALEQLGLAVERKRSGRRESFGL